MDDATIRAHLNGGRRTILDILDEHPALTRETIGPAWIAHGALPSRAGTDWLQRAISQLLWQLLNLEWIEETEGLLFLTPLGARARTLAVRG